MVSWREREARNEADARARNEWIDAASQSFGAHAATETFVCECGDASCNCMIEPIPAPLAKPPELLIVNGGGPLGRHVCSSPLENAPSTRGGGHSRSGPSLSRRSGNRRGHF
jgi:hypothetical protein